MATVNAVVLKHHKKENGTWNVKISLSHNSNTKYIETSAFVTKSSLDTKGKLKKSFIEQNFAKVLSDYRDKITSLGSRINYMDCGDIKGYLLGSEKREEQIDVIRVIDLKVAELLDQDRKSTADIYAALGSHLKSFAGTSSISVISISPDFVYKFDQYLRKIVQLSSLRTYMSKFNTLFVEMRKRYNNPSIDFFPIPYNPLENYILPTPAPKMRRNLSIDRIRQIINLETEYLSEQTAKDMFLLSLMLCGMNSKDIYTYITSNSVGNDLEYRRSKVLNRKDGGLINISIPDITKPLIEKYGGVIQSRFKNNRIFNHELAGAWATLSKKLGFKCSMYYARHSFANIARQVCKFSKEEVALALNHKSGNDITDVYIEPDWSVVHNVQKAVISEVFYKGGSN